MVPGRPTLALLSMLVLLALSPALSEGTSGPVLQEATGVEAGTNATVHWLELWGSVVAFEVAGENGTACLAERLPAGPQDVGTGCRGAAVNVTGLLLNTSGAERFFARTATATVMAAPTTSNALGVVVLVAAVVFLALTALLAYLFVQERRIARFLVRRLYEETKGRVPPDWPEAMKRAWIARVFVRGKN